MKRENLHDVKLAQTRCQNFSMSKIDHLCQNFSMWKIDHLYNKLAVVIGVCFVLSCWDLPILWCFMLASWYLPKSSLISCRPLDIYGKLAQWVYGCIHLVWDCLELPCESYWLLNHFVNEKLNKITTGNCIGVWGSSRSSWKAHHQSDFIDFYFTIFRAKVWKILIFF